MKILRNGEWITGIPVVGEICQKPVGNNGGFVEGVYSIEEIPQVKYRRITSNAFWNRVGEDKEDTLRVMALNAMENKDTKLTNRLRKIDTGEYVGLDDINLIQGFEALMVDGLFTQSEIDFIFVC